MHLNNKVLETHLSTPISQTFALIAPAGRQFCAAKLTPGQRADSISEAGFKKSVFLCLYDRACWWDGQFVAQFVAGCGTQ
jgi:hypothetical protein